MKKYFAVILILLAFFLCGSLQYVSAADIQDEESSLFWPPPPAEPRIFFVRNIYTPKDMGVKKSVLGRMKDFLIGRKDYTFSRPMAVAAGKEGALYIAEAGAGAVYIYKPEKKRLHRINRIDKEIYLVSPVGIGVSEDGMIFIADSYLKKVFAINEKGVSRFIFGEQDGLQRPTGIFVKNEKLYVVDTVSCQVSVFDMQGHLLFKFGNPGKGEGELNAPTHIYVDDVGRSYVSDTLNSRIQIFDPHGKAIKTIGSIGDSSGYFSRPKGVAIDSSGHIYVVDAIFDNIQIFDYDKNFLLSLGKTGSEEGEFWLPAGIAIDKDNYIYVADSYNQRISVFHYIGK